MVISGIALVGPAEDQLDVLLDLVRTGYDR
jgi:hypothetical protein